MPHIIEGAPPSLKEHAQWIIESRRGHFRCALRRRDDAKHETERRQQELDSAVAVLIKLDAEYLETYGEPCPTTEGPC